MLPPSNMRSTPMYTCHPYRPKKSRLSSLMLFYNRDWCGASIVQLTRQFARIIEQQILIHLLRPQFAKIPNLQSTPPVAITQRICISGIPSAGGALFVGLLHRTHEYAIRRIFVRSYLYSWILVNMHQNRSQFVNSSVIYKLRGVEVLHLP
jgi:hypothetical protein